MHCEIQYVLNRFNALGEAYDGDDHLFLHRQEL